MSLSKYFSISVPEVLVLTLALGTKHYKNGSTILCPKSVISRHIMCHPDVGTISQITNAPLFWRMTTLTIWRFDFRIDLLVLLAYSVVT